MTDRDIRDHILNTILDISSEQIGPIHADFLASSQQSHHYLVSWTPQTLSRLVDQDFPFGESTVVSHPPPDRRNSSPRLPNEARIVCKTGPEGGDQFADGRVQQCRVASVTDTADGTGALWQFGQSVSFVGDGKRLVWDQLEWDRSSSARNRLYDFQPRYEEPGVDESSAIPSLCSQSLAARCPPEPENLLIERPALFASPIPKGMRPIVGRLQENHLSVAGGEDATNYQVSRRVTRKSTICNYCRNNNESTQVFASHSTENCPILGKFECPICKQRGHTISHCKLAVSSGDEEAPQSRSILRQMLQMNAQLGAAKY